MDEKALVRLFECIHAYIYIHTYLSFTTFNFITTHTPIIITIDKLLLALLAERQKLQCVTKGAGCQLEEKERGRSEASSKSASLMCIYYLDTVISMMMAYLNDTVFIQW